MEPIGPPSPPSNPLFPPAPPFVAPSLDSLSLTPQQQQEAAAAASSPPPPPQAQHRQLLDLIPGGSQPSKASSPPSNVGWATVPGSHASSAHVQAGPMGGGANDGTTSQGGDQGEFVRIVAVSTDSTAGYWVETRGGRVQKLLLQDSSRYPQLVQAFDHAVRTGTLPPFSLATANVRPEDLPVKVSIPKPPRPNVSSAVSSPGASSSGALPSRRAASKPKASYAEHDEDEDDDLSEVSSEEDEAPSTLKIKVKIPAAAAQVAGGADAGKGKGKVKVVERKTVNVNLNPDEQDEIESESEEEDGSEEEEEEESDGYGGEEDGEKPTRSSTRTTRVQKSLREDGVTDSHVPAKSSRRSSGQSGSRDSEEEDAASYASGGKRSSGRAIRPSRKARGSSADDDAFFTTNKRKPAAAKRTRDASEEYYDHEDEDELAHDDDAILKKHRAGCEKCSEPAADILLEKYKARTSRGGGNKSRKPNKRRDEHEDDIMSDGEAIDKMGGWIECENCCVAAHFGCLSETQRTGILKKASADAGEKVRTIKVNQATTFLCGKCSMTTHCFSCGFDTVDGHNHPPPVVKIVAPPAPVPGTINPDGTVVPDAPFPAPTPVVDQDQAPIASGSGSAMEGIESSVPYPVASNALPLPVVVEGAAQLPGDGDVVMQEEVPVEEEPEEELPPRELLFRCLRCKRGCHYAHLVAPINDAGWDYETPTTPVKLAEFYQWKQWTCHDCYRWIDDVDKIIAWRPFPANATERKRKVGEVPSWKDPLPREYLVKWKLSGFRHTEWVPHAWLQANSQPRLRNFLTTGSQLQLLVAGAESAEKGDGEPSVADLLGSGPPEERRESALHKNQVQAAVFSFGSTPVADPDAETRLPEAWMTFDRILDVYLNVGTKPNRKKSSTVTSEEEEEEEEEQDPKMQGVQPYVEEMIQIDEWEKKNGKLDAKTAVKAVVWCYVKCGDLPYSEATWDSPPLRSSIVEYAAYKNALAMYLAGRDVLIPILTKAEAAKRDSKNPAAFKKLNQQPSWMAGGKLMPFQLDGVNWLTFKWWELKSCILADDMGLGKTVQIAALVGVLGKQYNTFPTLIVVPNSTVTNWVREFEKWVPHIRVVPYHGEKGSKAIIEEYELFHRNTRQLKAHCVITTYDIITSASFKVLQEIPRWEMLVVDEGQRLKSDTNLIFQRLKMLNCRQKVLLTGTPLNNNMRELFNLLSFLDPDAWSDLERLEREFEDLDTEKVQQLHEKLQPYFLRRIKADVLKLPPKHEIILPISLSKLQKEQYKALMLRNAAMIQELSAEATSKIKTEKAKKTQLGSLNNLMMQLRKTCQHPYLVQPELEDRTVAIADAHARMTDASAKLALLKLMLPRLQARGHRVLLFSQFKIALDIIQDWLDGENLAYIRLDGDTAQAQRQKDMDRFNAPNSDLFMYLLSTRAGGVGVNLATADTVIVFDPDFNPHQDLQAIARAYRFGQKKKVLVFKFMSKDTVEEKIFQKGRKKMVLDHLIVQNMSKEEDTDVQSMITFGAKALFEDEGTADITYTGQDVDELIKRVEETEEESQNEAKGMTFGFAKIWEASKAAEDENVDVEAPPPEEDAGFWDAIVKRAAVEKQKEIEAMGRGAQRNRKRTQYAEAPHSPSGRGHRTLRDSESPFSGSESENSDSDSASEGPLSPESKQISQGVKRTRQRKVAPQEQNGRRLGTEPTTSDPKAVLRAMAAIGEKIEIASALSPLLHEATSRQVHPDRRRALFDQAVTIFVPAMHLFNFPTDAFVPHYPSVVKYITSMPYLSNGQSAPAPIQQQRPHQPLPPRAAPVAGPSSSSSTPQPTFQPTTDPSFIPPQPENGVAGPSNGVAGPSVSQLPPASVAKRPSPTQQAIDIPDSPPAKKQRLPEEEICPYCQVLPGHPLVECRIVRRGAGSIALRLKNLGPDNELYAPLKRQGAKLFGADLSREIAKLEDVA